MGIDTIPKDLVWQVDFAPILNKKVRIETKQGNYREGVLSSVTYNKISYFARGGGFTLYWPQELELNRESSDRISFELVKTLQVLP